MSHLFIDFFRVSNITFSPSTLSNMDRQLLHQIFVKYIILIMKTKTLVFLEKWCFKNSSFWHFKDCFEMNVPLQMTFTTFSGHFFTICMFIFHKTEVLTVILRCLTGLTYDWFKTQIFPFLFFFNFLQKHTFSSFAFYFVLCFFS